MIVNTNLAKAPITVLVQTTCSGKTFPINKVLENPNEKTTAVQYIGVISRIIIDLEPFKIVLQYITHEQKLHDSNERCTFIERTA